MNNDCSLQEIPAQTTLALQFKLAPSEFSRHFGPAFEQLFKHILSLEVKPVSNTYTRFSHMDQPIWDVEIGVGVPHTVRPSGEYITSAIQNCIAATTLHQGDLIEMPKVYSRLIRWIQEQKHIPGPYVYNMHMTDPRITAPEFNYTGMMIPLLSVHGK